MGIFNLYIVNYYYYYYYYY